jgi:hypothetical protein
MKYLNKLNSVIYTILGLAFTHVGFAQGNPSPEATDRGIVPELGLPTNDSGAGGEASGDVTASDAGAQRPVKLKKKGVSTFFGYSSKYFYRSNPLMASGKLSQQKTAMWTNAFFAGAGLGVIETDSSVITPYVGASWTINDYIQGGLDTLNYNSSGAYALLLAQYGNGWSARAGINYASDASTENDTEDYSEFFPNIGVMKAYALTDSTLGIFNASAGKHITSSFDIFKGIDAGTLDNWEISSSYGLKWNASQNLSFAPQYRLSYKLYDEGTNKERDDLTNAVSLRIAYQLGSSVTLDLSTSYSKRTTSGVPIDLDFKNLDTGGGLSLNARF